MNDDIPLPFPLLKVHCAWPTWSLLGHFVAYEEESKRTNYCIPRQRDSRFTHRIILLPKVVEKKIGVSFRVELDHKMKT